MEPIPKHPVIEQTLESVAGRTTAIRADRCVNPPIGCGQPITGFKDEISEREYLISGLCSACQDIVFAEPPEPPAPSPAQQRLLDKMAIADRNCGRANGSKRRFKKWVGAYTKLAVRLSKSGYPID